MFPVLPQSIFSPSSLPKAQSFIKTSQHIYSDLSLCDPKSELNVNILTFNSQETQMLCCVFWPFLAVSCLQHEVWVWGSGPHDVFSSVKAAAAAQRCRSRSPLCLWKTSPPSFLFFFSSPPPSPLPVGTAFAEPPTWHFVVTEVRTDNEVRRSLAGSRPTGAPSSNGDSVFRRGCRADTLNRNNEGRSQRG